MNEVNRGVDASAPRSRRSVLDLLLGSARLDEPEHGAVAEDARAGKIGCSTSGCHGPAHDLGGGKTAAAWPERGKP